MFTEACFQIFKLDIENKLVFIKGKRETGYIRTLGLTHTHYYI